MANNVIELVLRVRDQASKALSSLRANLFSLKGAVAGVGVGVALNALVRNMVEAEQSALRLDVAFRNMGKGTGLTRARLDELATELQRTTTVSDDAVKQAEALLLSFDNVRGEAFERTIRVANDLSTALGTDLVTATQKLGRAMQDPAGSLGLLARSGVKLSSSMEEVIKKLAETGRTAQAQDILLTELEKRFGGVAEAARNTLGGALTGLKNQLGELFEGDASSFGNATAAVNDLSKALDNPKNKQAMDTLIAGLATAAGWLTTIAEKLVNGTVLWAQYFAAMGRGGDPGLSPFRSDGSQAGNPLAKQVQDLEDAKARLATLKGDLKGMDEAVRLGYDSRGAIAAKMPDQRKAVAELQAYVDNLQRIVDEAYANAQERVRESLAMRGLEPIEIKVERIDTTGADAAKKAADDKAAKEAAEALAKLQAARDATLGAVDKVLEEWKVSEKKIADAVKSGAITAAEGQRAIESLAADIRASVLPESETFGSDFIRQIDLVMAALERGKITAAEAGAAIVELRAKLADDVGPSWLKQAHEWQVAEDRIRTAVEQRILTVEQANAALKELQEANLEPIQITATPLRLEQPKVEVNEFAVQAARNIQDSFADAFMNIGDGWKGTVQGFLDGFKTILAQAASMQLAKALGLDAILSGKSSTGGLGALLEKLFPSTKAEPKSSPQLEAYDKATGPVPGTLKVDAPASIPVDAPPFIPVKFDPLTIEQPPPLQVEQQPPLVVDAPAFIPVQADPLKIEAPPPLQIDVPDLPPLTVEPQKPIPVDAPASIPLTMPTAEQAAQADCCAQLLAAIQGQAMSGEVAAQSPVAGVLDATAQIVQGEDKVPEEVAGKVGDQVSGQVTASLDKFASGLLGILGPMAGKWGNIVSSVLGNIWEIVKAAIAAITTMMAAKQASDTAGTVVSAVGAVAAGSAGGGRIPAGKARLVGEEGPEIIMPAEASTVVNARQLAFAGAGNVSFAPSYNIVIQGARDDQGMFTQLAAYIERRDAQNKVEMMEMLRRNGLGRMSR